ncbi:MAG: hypothetical protein MUF62_11610 [Chitinophagaceae bacterium]|nr:hypothetical protein [Chitinophagaceae bacterium]
MLLRIKWLPLPAWCRIWLWALLLAGCSQPDPYTAVTEAEAVAFGKQWAAALNNGDAKKAEELFSRQAFATEMAQYNFYDLSKADIDTRAERFPLDRVVASTGAQTVQGGHYRYLGRFAKDGRQYVRMRQWSRAGLNYHELLLIKENDAVKVADLFLYHTGSTVSADYMQEIRNYEKSGNSRQAQYFEELRQEIMWEGVGEDARGVLEKYDQLPEQLQRQQRMNYFALLAAIRLADDTAKAGRLYRLYVANNHTRPDRLLIDVQYAVFKRQHPKAMASIDSLGQLTGDDKWLVFFKAVASMYSGQLDTAAAYLQQSMKNNRNFGDNYFYLTQLLALKGKWPEARLMLDRYRRHPDFSGTLENELVAAFPLLDARE